jgi:hypothetical protein
MFEVDSLYDVRDEDLIKFAEDGKRDKHEEEFILKQLGTFCLFPHKIREDFTLKAIG